MTERANDNDIQINSILDDIENQIREISHDAEIKTLEDVEGLRTFLSEQYDTRLASRLQELNMNIHNLPENYKNQIEVKKQFFFDIHMKQFER